MKQRFQLLTFFMLLSVMAFSQQITVKKFGQANQFIPSENQLRDWDNELCALVKIQGAKIDSVSGAFDVVKHAAETWVYMTSGDRKLTIFKQGYEPKEVYFNEFGVDDVKSNKVYLMTVYAPELAKQKLFIGLEAYLPFQVYGLVDGVGYGSAEWIVGFNVGGSVTYMFSDLFGAATGLYFSTKGYKYSDMNIVNEKGDFQFVEIPVQALVQLNLSDALALQFLAGPYCSINVGGKIKADFPWTDEKFSDKYSSFQIGGQAGLKLIFAKHYAIGADYQYGFGNYKNQNIAVHLGYIF